MLLVRRRNQVAVLQRNLHLTVNGESIALQPQDAQLDFLPGQGGLQTTRIALWFTAEMIVLKVSQVDYHDDNFAGRLGWQEIVVEFGLCPLLVFAAFGRGAGLRGYWCGRLFRRLAETGADPAR